MQNTRLHTDPKVMEIDGLVFHNIILDRTKFADETIKAFVDLTKQYKVKDNFRYTVVENATQEEAKELLLNDTKALLQMGGEDISVKVVCIDNEAIAIRWYVGTVDKPLYGQFHSGYYTEDLFNLLQQHLG